MSFFVISCLGAPTRHLLIPRDPFQLLEKVSGKSPESFPESLPIWVKARVSIYLQFWTVQLGFQIFWPTTYYFWSFTWTILNRLLSPFNILAPFTLTLKIFRTLHCYTSIPSDRPSVIFQFKKPSTIVLDPPFLMQMTVQFGLRTRYYFWLNYVVYLTLLLIILDYKVQWHEPT